MPLKVLFLFSSLAVILLLGDETTRAQVPPDSLESICNVTQPNGVGRWGSENSYGNEALSTYMFPRGTVVFWPAAPE